MKPTDRIEFSALLCAAMGFFKQDMSTFALTVWWEACKSFDMEQVSKALTAHTIDPEQGRFPPKPADVVRMLHGTRTDRALIAWSKVMDAMQRVGAYSSVVFDDGVIHAVIEDLGGWVAICRGELKDLPHVERRFCESYRAYAVRGSVVFPAMLSGAHDANNALKGFKCQPPALIGNVKMAGDVMRLGSSLPKTQITFQNAVGAVIERIGGTPLAQAA